MHRFAPIFDPNLSVVTLAPERCLSKTQGMSKRIGYTRVSTDDQNLDLQRNVLTRAGCATIYEERALSKSQLCVELEHCCKAMRAGDTVGPGGWTACGAVCLTW